MLAAGKALILAVSIPSFRKTRKLGQPQLWWWRQRWASPPIVLINGWNRLNIALRTVPGTYQPAKARELKKSA
jgi:hypothetical protein